MLYTIVLQSVCEPLGQVAAEAQSSVPVYMRLRIPQFKLIWDMNHRISRRDPSIHTLHTTTGTWWFNSSARGATCFMCSVPLWHYWWICSYECFATNSLFFFFPPHLLFHLRQFSLGAQTKDPCGLRAIRRLTWQHCKPKAFKQNHRKHTDTYKTVSVHRHMWILPFTQPKS